MAGAGETESETRRRRARVFALTWVSYASYYFTRKNFSVAKKTLETEQHLTRGGLAAIDTGHLAAYAVGQFAFGWLADKVGPRRVLAFGMLATAAVSAAFGSASLFLPFLVIWTINGLFQSSGWSPNVKAMSAHFAEGKRGPLMGLWTTCYQIGPLVVGWSVAPIIAAVGWRWAFRVPAIWVALVGVALFFFLPDAPRADGEAVATTAAGAAAQATTDHAARRDARREVLATPLVWSLGSAYFFMKLTRYALLGWLTYFNQDRLHYSVSKAAYVALAFEAGGALGSVTIGWASDKFLAGRRVPLGVAGMLGLAASLPLFAWASPLGVLPNVASLALVGFFLFGPDALLSATAAQDIGGPAGAGTAAGIINGMGSIGAISSGYLVAWVSVAYGWSAVFQVLAGGAVLSALILAPFWRARNSRT